MLDMILPFLDATILKDDTCAEEITALCETAKATTPKIASVCIPAEFVALAKAALNGTTIKVCTVANFPKGNSPIEKVQAEIHAALKQGADEIDVVMPYQHYLDQQPQLAIDFIKACRAAIPSHITMKVIMETGALQATSLITSASKDMIEAGADFLKTSTGKIKPGATLQAALIMLTVIAEVNPKVGFKASGGVGDVETAQNYLQTTRKILGDDWLTPAHFRIGASSLLPYQVRL